MPGHIFISHASKDDAFVRQLREALEANKLPVWVDSRRLSGGHKLTLEIEKAIEESRRVIVIVSLDALNSEWVQREIKKSLEVERQRKGDGYKVIPLMMPGIKPPALKLLFGEEPIGVSVELGTSGVSEALPAILAALGERLPDDPRPPQTTQSKPVEELMLKLSDPRVQESGGQRLAMAMAVLVYEPADESRREVESRRFTFTAPLGLIEAPDWLEDLRWYLEDYFRWPTGVFKTRADRIEAQLPQWGRLLYDAAARTDSAKDILRAWRNAADGAERRFSVIVDHDLPEGASQEEQAVAGEAASLLLSLPWELLHDGRGYLFQGRHSVRVRRRLPNRIEQRPVARDLPIRILLVSPRPEEKDIGYIDHRISALPLVEAVENLGALAELTVLSPPTFAALREALMRAADAGEPFDVVHFDGHGVYDRKVGLGGLCFEHPKDADKLEERAMQLIHAEKMAAVMRDHRIPLVFLEACQSAQTELDPTASVAAKLLEEGVTSVVAMSHSVLVETAHRFVKAFYQELARGARIGTAMLAGQRALIGDTFRGRVMGAGELHLQDWFVPVLYQEEQDPPLITRLPSEQVRLLQARQRRLSLGALPDTPAHSFIGRSRELLKLERLLRQQPYAVVSGIGGEGKTTLAVELARWLVRTGRFRRAAFVSLEHFTDARSVLDSLGRQLLPQGENWSVAHYRDLKEALQPVERALSDHPTLIVLDNCESILPSTKTHEDARSKEENFRETSCDLVDGLFSLCRSLLDAHPATRIVFTSRESLPVPFAERANEVRLGKLSREDAVALVSQVMKQEGLTLKADDSGYDNEEVVQLVEAVNRHARALALLAREVARQGVRATTENLRRLMAELDKKHPGDRENSLYASVELSLRRLPPELREPCRALSVFHGGMQLDVLTMVLNGNRETADRLSHALIEVGLAEEVGYGHLRLDPALPNYLLSRMDADEGRTARDRWAEAMQVLTDFLYRQIGKDTPIAANLTLLELPNLLAVLEWSEHWESSEQVVNLASQLEKLLENSGRPKTLVQVSRVREQAARGLAEWSHARFLTEVTSFERLLERGQLPNALAAARQLLARCQAASSDVFPEAAYDLASAHINLGRVLGLIGDAKAALNELAEAQRRFEDLAAGNQSAERMAAIALAESGYSLRNLGRLDAAAAIYEEAIKRAEKRDDTREVAVNKGQLGTVRMYQQRYGDALKALAESGVIFESLGEPRAIATTWHQVAMVHYGAGQFEQAERAYRQSLAISVQQDSPAREADTLNGLGNLYDTMERLNEAVTVYSQAADLYARLRDQMKEGLARSNLANAYIKLRRYDEARVEIRRAIECKEPFSHTAEPWKTWNILHNLEQATGHVAGATEAREQAIFSYLAYRRDGGFSQSPRAKIYAGAAQAIYEQQTDEAEKALAQLADEVTERWQQTVIAGLQAILRGDRDPALARDPNLPYRDAAELQLLLEEFGV